MQLRLKNVAGSAEADASLGIIDADSGAGGVELVYVVLTALAAVLGIREEQSSALCRDGWLGRLFDR